MDVPSKHGLARQHNLISYKMSRPESSLDQLLTSDYKGSSSPNILMIHSELVITCSILFLVLSAISLQKTGSS